MPSELELAPPALAVDCDAERTASAERTHSAPELRMQAGTAPSPATSAKVDEVAFRAFTAPWELLSATFALSTAPFPGIFRSATCSVSEPPSGATS